MRKSVFAVITTLFCIAELAYAAGGEVTILMPSKSGVKSPSARVINPAPSDQKTKEEMNRIIAEFKKVSLVEVSPRELLVTDCVLSVGKQLTEVSCFMLGQYGGKCTLGPSSIPNRQVVGFLGTYYRGCEMNGIIPAEHGRNQKK